MGLFWSLAFSIHFLFLSSSLFPSMHAVHHHPTHQCHDDEGHALFHFKESFLIRDFASLNPSGYPKTSSWMQSTDCCSWDGIQCDVVTGHVIGIYLSSSLLYGSLDANSTLFSLVHLQNLDLSDNHFNHSQIPARIGELSQLQYLNLSHITGTTFSGDVPPQISHLRNLLFLDLRSCLGYIPGDINNVLRLNISALKSLIQNSTRLVQLRLDFVIISSPLPHTLTNLTYLEKLTLFNCDLYGEFPIDMFLKLKFLRTLRLDENKLSLLAHSSSSNVTLPPIQALGLRSCNLSSEIPSWIMNLTNLTILDLTGNNLHGEIPSLITNLTNLAALDLTGNNLHGEIPHSLFNLENLVVLSLAFNSFEGQLEFDMFLKLKMLTILELSGNYNLSLLNGKVSSNATLSPLQVLILDSCNLGEFPIVLRHLDKLVALQMSNNDLKSIPKWIWRKRSLQVLSISNSSLTGEISPLICNLKSLAYLDLSNNNLSGMIPSCLGSFSQYLQTLMLQGNKLVGRIPQNFMKGSALKMVALRDNKLHGPLPRALVNCRMLEFLDVSNNMINGSFPYWLGTLPELKVIALRNNDFYGAIMCPKRCRFSKLHIIDLSHNKFSGNLLPDTIKSWKSMAVSNISQLAYEDNNVRLRGRTWGRYTYYTFTMSTKGVDLNYEVLQLFYNLLAIDLSGNRICGEIPDVMGDLKNLVLLNLSNNMLSGSIPSSLGKLSSLEALDLSQNSLSGKIPQQLTELTFLEFFNVSFNNLSGPIPESKQFSTFQGTSFEGNQGLCGTQLAKKCEDHAVLSLPASNGDQDSDWGCFIEFDWKVIAIGYGGGLVAGLALGNAFSSDIIRWLNRIFN